METTISIRRLGMNKTILLTTDLSALIQANPPYVPTQDVIPVGGLFLRL